MLKRRTFVGELSAEFLGTFFILLFGIASVVQAYAYPGGINTTSNIPWAWGFAVALGVYVASGLSGAHLNPAVTLALALRRDFPRRRVVPYWIAQIFGAFVAAGWTTGTTTPRSSTSIPARRSRASSSSPLSHKPVLLTRQPPAAHRAAR